MLALDPEVVTRRISPFLADENLNDAAISDKLIGFNCRQTLKTPYIIIYYLNQSTNEEVYLWEEDLAVVEVAVLVVS
ncbi:hypothetical protein [Sporomusa sp. KB1]|uniref:hypothetical protein n=1 Tax=Sporomusa sp. KB1 TaxID=943346 RepID=UPI001647D4C5|nr:hypothetical protein [Sporomusa sp. KB1]